MEPKGTACPVYTETSLYCSIWFCQLTVWLFLLKLSTTILHFARWTKQQVNFIRRLKKNAVYTVENVMYEKELPDKEYEVLKDEHIHLDYKENKENK